MGSQSPRQLSYDVVVIGGGPAGSTAASVLAMAGRKVLLLERDRFPRYHIGESLLPSTIQGVCRFLGVQKEMEDAGFLKKFGGILRWGSNPKPWTFAFAEAEILKEKAGEVFAYQVTRSKFDEILLRNAERKGVEVCEEHRVLGPVMENGRAVGVKYDSDHGSGTVSCRYVVDATGQVGVCVPQVGKRQYDEFFRNIAVFGYYEGAERVLDSKGRFGSMIAAAFSDGWIWYIPLSEDVHSVGVVLNREHLETLQKMGAEQVLDHYLGRCELIAGLLKNAKRITEGDFGKVRILKDYSYFNDQLFDKGIVLVGDAACFIDPVFSSGVHLATYAGLLAGRSINSCLSGLDEQRVFAEFGARYRREFNVFYEFLTSFYEMHHDEGSYFWSARKVLGNDAENARTAFVKLVAGFSHAQEEMGLVAQTAVDDLKTLTDTLKTAAESGADGIPMETRKKLAERSQKRMQERLHLYRLGNKGVITQQEVPMLAGGLVPSADGLKWEESA